MNSRIYELQLKPTHLVRCTPERVQPCVRLDEDLGRRSALLRRIVLQRAVVEGLLDGGAAAILARRAVAVLLDHMEGHLTVDHMGHVIKLHLGLSRESGRLSILP